MFPWTESTITWSAFGSSLDRNVMYSNTSEYASAAGTSLMKTNLLGLIKNCIITNTLPTNGIVFVSADETLRIATRDFCSTEYADANNGNLMPYFTFTYGTSVDYSQVKLKILIDDSFAVRCKMTYPELSNTDAVNQRIDELLSPVIQMYKERYEIQLSVLPVVKISTSIDQCPQASNLDSTCQCEDAYPVHHTNQDLVALSVPDGDPDNYLNLFFTGHKTCSLDEDNECTGDLDELGIAWRSDCRAIIYNVLTYDTSQDDLISMTIAHELGHLFYVRDHYGEHPNLFGQNECCIWGDDVQNAMVSLTACAFCENILYNNKYLYDHS